MAFHQSDKTQAVSCRGAARVFSRTNSRLMQNKKRASLNIQHEKLQSQQSIWPLLLFATTSFHSPTLSEHSYSSTPIIFFNQPAFFFFSSCVTFLAALTFIPFFGCYIVLQLPTSILHIYHVRNEATETRRAAFVVENDGKEFPVWSFIQDLTSLCRVTKQVKRHIQFSSLEEDLRI